MSLFKRRFRKTVAKTKDFKIRVVAFEPYAEASLREGDIEDVLLKAFSTWKPLPVTGPNTRRYVAFPLAVEVRVTGGELDERAFRHELFRVLLSINVPRTEAEERARFEKWLEAGGITRGDLLQATWIRIWP